MAKRGGSELNHENWNQEEEREDAGTFRKATDGDMKGRVIKKARRRNAGGEEGGEKKNVFSGFGGFSAKPDASAAFSFLSKPAEPEKPAAAAGGFVFGSAAAKPAQTGFSFGSQSSGPAKPSFGAFGASESKSDSPAPAPVFGSFAAEKSSPSSTPLFGSKSDSPAPANTFGSFAFGAKKDSPPPPAVTKAEEAPTATKSDFSAFKQPPADSPKAVEKPTPTFGSGGGFNFGGDTSAKSDSAPSASLFSFGAAAATKQADTKEGGGGGFSFGAKTSGEKPAGTAFSFGSSGSAEKSEVGGFSFGAKPAETSKPSDTGFSFGSKASDSSNSNTASSFSFGEKPDTVTEKPAASNFSFGVKSDSDKQPIGGSFSFGSKSNSPAEAVTGAKQDCRQGDKETGSKDDSTGGVSTEYLSHLKALNLQVLAWLKQHVDSNPLVILSPVFKDYDKHLEEITQQFQKEATPVQEETPASTASSVTISSPATKSDPKPLGLAAFGAQKTSSSSTVSPFSFGSTSDKPVQSTPPFSFGSSAPPSSGFGASSGGFAAAGAGFSFGSGALGAASANTDTAGKKQDGEGAEDDEDQPPVVEVKQVEESDAIYDKKCKLFYKKDGSYVEKGVGMLYLKSVEGGKTQLLVRADTNLGNVLLNILLNPQIPTTRVGKNNVMLVCVPNPPVDPKADSSAPCPMLLRVKTGEDADELKAKLDELKEEKS